MLCEEYKNLEIELDTKLLFLTFTMNSAEIFADIEKDVNTIADNFYPLPHLFHDANIDLLPPVQVKIIFIYV